MVVPLPVAAAAVPAAMYVSSKLSLPQDLRQIKSVIGSKLAYKNMEKNDTINVTYRFEECFRKNPDREALVFEGKSYTYRDIQLASNKIGNWLLAKGVKRGDIVSLFMLNKPEFIFCWLGINKIGATAAFINTNLTGKPLTHSLRTATASMLLMDTELAGSIEESLEEVQQLGYSIYSYGGPEMFDFATPMDLSVISDANTPEHLRRNTLAGDVAMLIYTSGTTGLPKAGRFAHSRAAAGPAFWARYYHFDENDRIYVALPLYHSAGSVLGVALSWNAGSTVILARKFSATHFWDDVRTNRATVIQYIGEICRYLLNTPESPLDKVHSVRMAHGNGMRPDVWTRFRDRFGIPLIGEWYASTEGTSAMANYNTGPQGAGAIGFRGSLATLLDKGLKIVKFDIQTEELIRDKNGWCIQCAPGEPGELLTLIDPAEPSRAFRGYHENESASNKKVAKNVFKAGDQYFRTGDILRQDSDGYFYFGDRVGDTFRWKSENVSTAEVSEVLSSYPDCIEVNVYGVQVPGQDGRAGMAAIVSKSTMDWDKFAAYALKNLPRYSVPIFIRKVPEMEITGTFKQRKVELVNEGMDPSKVSDEMLWLDGHSYRSFKAAEHQRVISGKAKL
ncbi:Fatty-acid-CoA ligase FadD6 [Haplosporangium sp. Z 767]|nr:Fatty-acid-CoA ligase FadD6 [Haplosporangium sp. Z 767]KAF9191692.1 Fatty-acid-CoA ligase FadD6 [Haplosporangium sp. Z 11]